MALSKPFKALQGQLLVLLLTLSFCSAYVGHGEVCDQSVSATSCNPTAELACRGGRCECINTDDMEYSATASRCLVLHGGSCYKAQFSNYRCTPSAFCQRSTRQCLCEYRHSPSNSRHCVASHGSTCDPSIECNTLDKLVCRFDKCRCPNPINHVFREAPVHECFIKVGASCTPNPGANAVTCDPEENECVADSSSVTGYSCQCLPGFVLHHFERKCLRGNNTVCTASEPNGELLHPRCDTNSGLICFAGKCQCNLSPDTEWDPILQECAVLEGRSCNLQDDDRLPFLDENYYFRCKTGLECVPFQGHAFEGTCRNKKAFINYPFSMNKAMFKN